MERGRNIEEGRNTEERGNTEDRRNAEERRNTEGIKVKKLLKWWMMTHGEREDTRQKSEGARRSRGKKHGLWKTDEGRRTKDIECRM